MDQLTKNLPTDVIDPKSLPGRRDAEVQTHRRTAMQGRAGLWDPGMRSSALVDLLFDSSPDLGAHTKRDLEIIILDLFCERIAFALSRDYDKWVGLPKEKKGKKKAKAPSRPKKKDDKSIFDPKQLKIADLGTSGCSLTD